MKSKDKLPEKPSKSSPKRKKIITTFSIAFAGLFSSCDKIPNNQIILDYDKQSVALSFEYQLGGPEGTRIDHNAIIQKKGDIFECTVKKSNRISSEKISIKSDNIDGLFEELANKSDSEQITEKTRRRRNAKLDFAKQAYKDSILNNKNPSKGEIIIKYKK